MNVTANLIVHSFVTIFLFFSLSLPWDFPSASEGSELSWGMNYILARFQLIGLFVSKPQPAIVYVQHWKWTYLIIVYPYLKNIANDQS